MCKDIVFIRITYLSEFRIYQKPAMSIQHVVSKDPTELHVEMRWLKIRIMKFINFVVLRLDIRLCIVRNLHKFLGNGLRNQPRLHVLRCPYIHVYYNLNKVEDNFHSTR